MRAITDLLANFAKPFLVAVVILIGFGLIGADPATGRTGSEGFDCKGFTNNPEWNRTLCRYHPRRIWTTSVGELVPWVDRLTER